MTDAHYYSYTAAHFLPSLRCILLTPLNSLLPGCLDGGGHCDPIQQSITPLLHWPYEFAALSISAGQKSPLNVSYASQSTSCIQEKQYYCETVSSIGAESAISAELLTVGVGICSPSARRKERRCWAIRDIFFRIITDLSSTLVLASWAVMEELN